MSPKIRSLSVIIVLLLLYIDVSALIGDYDYKIPKFPNVKSLPPPVKNFVGRHDELEKLNVCLDFQNIQSFVRIIGIMGSPGFGKSALAIQVIHEVPRTVQVIYIDMSTIHSLDKLAIQLHEHDKFNFTEENAFYRAILDWGDALTTRTILFLDNCDDILIGDQKHDFKSILRKLCQNEKQFCKIVFTSQVKVSLPEEEFLSIHVDTLTRNETIELIRNIVKRNMDVENLNEIASIVGDMPLAAKIIASVIEIDKISPSEIISQFIAHKNTIIEKLSPPEFPLEDRIATCLTIAYQNLQEKTRRCARLLAKFPGSFCHSAADHIIHFPYNTFRKYFQTSLQIPCIDELLSKSLLERTISYEESRYNFHQLIRTFLNDVEKNRELLQLEVDTFKAAFISYYRIVTNAFNSLIFEVLYPNQQDATAVQMKSNPVMSIEILTYKFMEAERHNVELFFEYLMTYSTLEYFFVENYVSYFPQIIKLTLFQATYNFKAQEEMYIYQKSRFFNTDKDILKKGKQLSYQLEAYLSWMDLYEPVMKQFLSPKEYYKLYLYVLLYNTVVLESGLDHAIELLNKRINKLKQLSSNLNDSEHVLLSRYIKHCAFRFRNMGYMIPFIEYLSIFVALKGLHYFDIDDPFNEIYMSALIEYEQKNYQKSISLFLEASEKFQYARSICYLKILLYYIYQDINELENADEMKLFILSKDTEELLLNEIKYAESKNIQEYIPEGDNEGYLFDESMMMTFLFYLSYNQDSEFYRLALHIYRQYWRRNFDLEDLNYEYIFPLEY